MAYACLQVDFGLISTCVCISDLQWCAVIKRVSQCPPRAAGLLFIKRQRRRGKENSRAPLADSLRFN
ncbi:uncharacterized protein LAJ45_00091 [Morchella importuna]|uniref:uncharacterized protein n=1 Tax=Morchella importuna TaxID=1174673 RepID=UPI001E8CAAF9|nr:uncharacterized protein LAJ45_00091 [Morchella importuna]KAH8155082.1 hypothetical protein LAJ45_00091 [Morchella importuna]